MKKYIVTVDNKFNYTIDANDPKDAITKTLEINGYQVLGIRRCASGANVITTLLNSNINSVCGYEVKFRKTTEGIKVFHASREGIKGRIIAKSRDLCDFGCGFYVGDTRKQPLSLIKDCPKGIFYEMSIDLSNLTLYKFDNEVEWALFIGVNRGKIDVTRYFRLRDLVKEINSYDVIYGVIADDNIAEAYGYFADDALSDLGLIESLKYINYGNQYVFKNDNACKNIKILSKRHITLDERKELHKESQKANQESKRILKDIRVRNYGKGRLMSQILEEDWH